MGAVIDLPRIRRALSELDRIAEAHPEMCQGIGQWTEQEVEKLLMGTPAKDRVKAMRERRAAQGIKREVFFATPEAQAALAELRALRHDQTRDNILCDALLTTLAAYAAPANPDPLAEYRRDWEEVHETALQLARDRNMPYRKVLRRALNDYSTLLDDRGPEQYTNPSQEPVAVEPPAQNTVPVDRAELAQHGHELLKAGMTAVSIAQEFNVKGWTPDRVPKAAGVKPRSDSATSWAGKAVAQLLTRDHPANG